MAESEKMARDASTDGFVCPPCQIFYPTPEEFKNPLLYIASIRAEAAQTGICKIVPPAGWRPPFAVNEKKFKFRTRLQPLNAIEGNSRQEGTFVEKWRLFLYRNGTPMEHTPVLDGLGTNFSTLYNIVCYYGGFDAVEKSAAWSTVVETLREVTDLTITPTIEEEVRSLYRTYFLSFELHEKNTKPTLSPAVKANTATMKTEPAVLKAEQRPSIGTDMAPAVPVKRGRGRPRKADSVKPATLVESKPSTPPLLRSDVAAQTTPIIFPGFIKRGRGRPRKADSAAIRLLSTEAQEPVDPALLEPTALAADPERTTRLSPPCVRVGQKYYRSFGAGSAVLGEVKRVLPGKKVMVQVEYPDGARDTISYGTMQLILANGSTSESAQLALQNDICQFCLRGDCVDRMVHCSGCNGGFHGFCLTRPVEDLPRGDWFCEICIAEQLSEKPTKFGFEMGAEHTLASFKAKADAWQQEYFQSSHVPSIQELEAEYWRIVTDPTRKIQVEYGSDVDTGTMGSGFPVLEKIKKIRNRLLDRYRAVHMTSPELQSPTDLSLKTMLAEGLELENESNFDAVNNLNMYATSPWNLTNLPKLNGSMLQYLDEDIKGVMVPWMYVGMCFSTFCWHVEDHNFYSISYLHRGAPKTWYGVPGHAADKMESVMRKVTPGLFGSQPDLHMQLVTMFSPETLQKHGVPVYRATHYPNEFIVTYPSSYHGGFNNGFNLAEAVNFATPDWISWGHIAVQNYKKFSKIPVFSHDALLLTVTLASLEGSGALDAGSVKAHVLPSLKTLRDETVAFHDAVRAHGIVKSEPMEGYLESHGRSTFSRASARIRLATADFDEDVEPVRLSKMMRTEKMKVGKMSVASNSRVSRQVLWAGRTGKHDGLRCTKCQQYCFVAAVVCFKCRAIGCSDHFASMCKCDVTTNGIWLHHVDTAVLTQYIDTLDSKFEQAHEWERELESITTLDQLNLALERSDQMKREHIEVSASRLYELKVAAAALQSWRNQALRCMQDGTLSELCELNRAAASLKYSMPEIQQIAELVTTTQSIQQQAQLVIQELQILKSDDANAPAQVSLESLHSENHVLGIFVRSIETLLADLGSTGIPETSTLHSELAYLNWLLAANALVEKSLANSTAVLSLSTELFPTISDIDAIWSSPARTLVSHSAKLDRLSQLRQICVDEAHKLQSFVNDIPKSLEEMGSQLRRLIQLPAFPLEVVRLLDKWKQSRVWTDEAAHALSTKVGWKEALALEEQAELHEIPPSSLLRRQLHSRIQDGKRWLARTHGLFRTELSQDEFSLQDALERSAIEEELTSLICICNQTYHERVAVVRCTGCTSLFHPPCVGVDPNQGHRSYMCKECCTSRRMPYHAVATVETLYCLCRTPIDNVPMICCDFCDEWYHAKCIGLSPVALSELEAYRCQACAFRQGMGNLVFKRPWRPTLRQVQGLIARGEALQIKVPGLDHLRNLVNDGVKVLEDVAAFERSFLDRCALPTIVDRLETLTTELNDNITIVQRVESLVQLEPAPNKLQTLQWFLRACRLIFCSTPAPRYSQLVILVADVVHGKLDFPTPDLCRFYKEIDLKLSRAVDWVKQVKALSSTCNLLALKEEAEGISQFLLLPDAAVSKFNLALKYHYGRS
ncbi:hypothetical protein, variant 1 [Aphanomyces invadans]|uniref:[Histone H3]-trimethyl-L-lysine(4) demethylase n=1 Tax=Aphanomyces invadans TaxID=157072 RepID=A0A024UUQ7_9STRA|nr:hypothetical protein, variant 1 [Aphanomyces invadans]ETW09373.1 hypothetical protein, variant 1 [Aphanomyces invadans]|eukprot:XP_008863178.1 hypothetical protein, variant 1 [Aphanomyces invadans]